MIMIMSQLYKRNSSGCINQSRNGFNSALYRVKYRKLDVLFKGIKQNLRNVIVVFHDTTIN